MTTAGPRFVLIRTDQLILHPHNVRRDYGDLRELADSIAEHGVIEPLIVEEHAGRGRVLAGHRRLLAARQAGVTRVPCVLRDPLPVPDAIALMVNENRHRQALTPAEKGHAARALVGTHGWSVARIATAFAVSGQTVRNWMAAPDHPGVSTPDPGGVEAARDQLITRARERATTRTNSAAGSSGKHRGPAIPGRAASVVSRRALSAFATRWEGQLPADAYTELRTLLGDPPPRTDT